MRKLSQTQITALEMVGEAGGYLPCTTRIAKSTLDSLESLGLIRFAIRRRSESYGRSMRGFSGHSWNTYTITLTEAGWAYLEGTLTEYPGKPRTLTVTRWGNYYA